MSYFYRSTFLGNRGARVRSRFPEVVGSKNGVARVSYLAYHRCPKDTNRVLLDMQIKPHKDATEKGPHYAVLAVIFSVIKMIVVDGDLDNGGFFFSVDVLGQSDVDAIKRKSFKPIVTQGVIGRVPRTLSAISLLKSPSYEHEEIDIGGEEESCEQEEAVRETRRNIEEILAPSPPLSPVVRRERAASAAEARASSVSPVVTAQPFTQPVVAIEQSVAAPTVAQSQVGAPATAPLTPTRRRFSDMLTDEQEDMLVKYLEKDVPYERALRLAKRSK